MTFAGSEAGFNYKQRRYWVSSDFFKGDCSYMKRIKLGMVGGGEGAFIGEVHRMASRLDDRYISLCWSSMF